MGPFSHLLTLADLFLDKLLLKVSLVSFQKKTAPDTMEYESQHFVGPFSCHLTLAQLFLDKLLLKVSLVSFQKKTASDTMEYET